MIGLLSKRALGITHDLPIGWPAAGVRHSNDLNIGRSLTIDDKKRESPKQISASTIWARRPLLRPFQDVLDSALELQVES